MWCLKGKGSPQQVVKQESLGETPRRTVTVKETGRSQVAVWRNLRGKVSSVKLCDTVGEARLGKVLWTQQMAVRGGAKNLVSMSET